MPLDIGEAKLQPPLIKKKKKYQISLDVGTVGTHRLFNLLMFQNIEAHSSDASQIIPQHNYKLDVHSLNARHPGEVCSLILILFLTLIYCIQLKFNM